MFVIDNRTLKLAPLERRDLSPQLRDARGVAGLLGVRQLPSLKREARRRIELTTSRLALRTDRVAPFGLARLLVGISRVGLVGVVVRHANRAERHNTSPQPHVAPEQERERVSRPRFFFRRLPLFGEASVLRCPPHGRWPEYASRSGEHLCESHCSRLGAAQRVHCCKPRGSPEAMEDQLLIYSQGRWRPGERRWAA